MSYSAPLPPHSIKALNALFIRIPIKKAIKIINANLKIGFVKLFIPNDRVLADASSVPTKNGSKAGRRNRHINIPSHGILFFFFTSSAIIKNFLLTKKKTAQRISIHLNTKNS